MLLKLSTCVVLGIALAIVGGCGSDDAEVKIVNDLNRTVRMVQCADNLCIDKPHSTGTLAPGDSFLANTSSSGVPNPWLVRELGGKRLGCLPLVMPEPTKGLVAKVSQRVPCQRAYDESNYWPPREAR